MLAYSLIILADNELLREIAKGLFLIAGITPALDMSKRSFSDSYRVTRFSIAVTAIYVAVLTAALPVWGPSVPDTVSIEIAREHFAFYIAMSIFVFSGVSTLGAAGVTAYKGAKEYLGESSTKHVLEESDGGGLQ